MPFGPLSKQRRPATKIGGSAPPAATPGTQTYKAMSAPPAATREEAFGYTARPES
jgi:hypothetical protein